MTLFDLRTQKIAASIETNIVIATKEIAKLQEFIASFPVNSITIKDAQNDLDKLDSNFWQDITKEKISFLDAYIKPLAKSIVGVDYKAMRFEKDVLAYSTYLLQNDKEKLQKQRDKLISQISELPLSINIVATQKELIIKAKEVKYWNHVIDSELDNLVVNLSPLMKYREELNPKQQVKYDFEDIIKEKEFVEFGADRESVSITKYKEMVENKITELLNKNPILQKLKNGENIAHDEIETLAKTLHYEDPYITIDLLRRVYMNKKAPFLKFIKHILGLEELKNFPDTVSESFDKFIRIHPTLTTTQLKFLELLKNYIIDNGDITKKDLIQAPFTVIHPSGIRGVFTPIEIEEILQITQELVS